MGVGWGGGSCPLGKSWGCWDSSTGQPGWNHLIQTHFPGEETEAWNCPRGWQLPGSPPLHRASPPPPELGGKGDMFIPSRYGPAGSGKAMSAAAQLCWRNSRAAPWWPSAWESAEVFLSLPASLLPASPVPTAVRHHWRQCPVELEEQRPGKEGLDP